MLIYEVNLEVEDKIKFSFAGWLTDHIQKMLKFKGFKMAYWFFRQPQDEEREPTDKTLWTIQYIVEDRPSLDDYLNSHSEAIRQEALDRFGDSFIASRRILNLLSVAGLPVDEGTKPE